MTEGGSLFVGEIGVSTEDASDQIFGVAHQLLRLMHRFGYAQNVALHRKHLRGRPVSFRQYSLERNHLVRRKKLLVKLKHGICIEASALSLLGHCSNELPTGEMAIREREGLKRGSRSLC